MIKKKKFPILIIIIVISIFTTGFTYPSPSADGAVLIESKTGRVLYSLNQHLKRPMASTTKIMTALLAIENGELDSIVKISPNAVGVEGSSIYLKEGEEISLRDLIYGLMLRSGNDAAIAIAEYISGSEEEFVKLMNKRAKEIGAINTNFTNPHGLHNPNHYSTAYDMALITREAMKLDFFKEVVKTKNWIANREINQFFSNKNNVLWKYKGGDGVKIGYTKASGRCLVASATRDNVQLIAVVLNDGNWFNDCYRMLDYGFEHYRPSLLLSKGQFLKKVQIHNGNREYLNILSDEDVIIPLKEEERERIKIIVDIDNHLKAPIVIGQNLGEVKFYLDGELIYSKDIKSNIEISQREPESNFIKFLKYFFK